MINGCWLSWHSPYPHTGRTFAADAVISNPPTFAHVHCAEYPYSWASVSSYLDYSLPIIFWYWDRVVMPWSVITKLHSINWKQFWPKKSTAVLQQLHFRILWSTSPPQMQAIVSVTTSVMLPQTYSLGRGKKGLFSFEGFSFFSDSSFCLVSVISSTYSVLLN